MAPTSFKDLIKDYCANCTFAGVHFIADDTKHWIERLVWLGLVALSWYGSALLIIAAWDDFVNNPISFGVDTIYTKWHTHMPAVAVCEKFNENKLFAVADEIWTPNHLIDLEDALKEIAYYRGESHKLMRHCYTNKNPNALCIMSNYSYYAYLIRSNCVNIMENCTYNNKQFDCCEYFQPIDTDIGKCFIINSFQIKNPKPFPMIGDMKNPRGVLSFEVNIPSVMYTLGQEEVPTITTLELSTVNIKLGHIYQRQVTVRNIENDPLVSQTALEQRACKFNDENDGGLYPLYSYSACTVQCRKMAQRDGCQCNDHFMIDTREEDHCNITGLACLHYNASYFTTLKPAWSARPGLVCDCIPSCNETEITVVRDMSTLNKKRKKKAIVEVVLAYLPSERFKRNVVRSRLDLVVSIGGTTGLFVGASILSFVELIFYFTVRFFNNMWMERKRRAETPPYLRDVTQPGYKMKIDDIIRHNVYETSSVIKLHKLDKQFLLKANPRVVNSKFRF